MSEHPALICAFDLSAGGASRPLSWQEISTKHKAEGWRWIHMDRRAGETEEWLRKGAKIPPLAVEALMAEETRPRVFQLGNGHMVILRGVNLNPGAAPEDLVSIRLWIEDDRIISLRRVRLLAIQDIREGIKAGTGPDSISGFLASLAMALLTRMSNVVIELEDAVDELEEEGAALPSAEQREKLMEIRRQAIPLRRFLSPQREVLQQLLTLNTSWLKADDLPRIREALEQASRLIETLDAIRERAGLLHEEMTNRMAERTNRNMYVLTVVAAIFLPLGLITGLLGINVGGIPGTDEPLAFLIVCLILVGAGIAEFVLLRLLRWI
jgi:zinc transporter